MRTRYITVVVLVTLAVAAVVVYAGSLDSTGAPGATSSYTLEDIYDRLDVGTAGSQSTFTEPGSGPGSTMHTLNDIMGKAPAQDNTNGATAADVASGKTAWGLTLGAWGVIAGTGTIATYAASVPKTGQTNCYDVLSNAQETCAAEHNGQDAYEDKGVSWPNLRFIDDGGATGVVTDTLTGLIWLKNANCPNGGKSWSDALTFANPLFDGWTGDGSGGDCGLSDNSAAGQWRLPNVREMQSLVHYGVYNPAVPNTAGTGKWTGNPFTGVQSNFYWSSTTCAPNAPRAWRVPLFDGYVYSGNKASTYYVWPVRGGQ